MSAARGTVIKRGRTRWVVLDLRRVALNSASSRARPTSERSARTVSIDDETVAALERTGPARRRAAGLGTGVEGQRARLRGGGRSAISPDVRASTSRSCRRSSGMPRSPSRATCTAMCGRRSARRRQIGSQHSAGGRPERSARAWLQSGSTGSLVRASCGQRTRPLTRAFVWRGHRGDSRPLAPTMTKMLVARSCICSTRRVHCSMWGRSCGESPETRPGSSSGVDFQLGAPVLVLGQQAAE